MLPRDKQDMFDEHMEWSRDCPAASATSTFALGTMKRNFRIESVELIDDAGYAADATNYYVLTLVHGTGPTTAATWSTLTGAQGALTAATPAAMVLSADANLVIPAGDVVSLVATKHASGANITVRVVVHGRYL